MAPLPVIKAVDEKVALDIIEQRSLVRLQTPGDNLHCGLFAMASSIRSPNNIQPLDWDSELSEEHLHFNRLQDCVKPAGDKLKSMNPELGKETPNTVDFFNVDMLAYILAHYNSLSTTSPKIKLYAIGADITYEISSPVNNPPHKKKDVEMLSIVIHNIADLHWEGYGHQGLGKVSKYADNPPGTADGPPSPHGSIAAAVTTATTTPAATWDEKYKAAELKYREKFKLSLDAKVDPESVKMAFTIDSTPLVDYHSESDDEDEPKPELKKDESNGTVPTGDTPAVEDVVKMYPVAGVDPIGELTTIARIQHPAEKSMDWQKVHSSDKFRCKLKVIRPNLRRSKQLYHPTQACNENGVGLTFSIESQDLAPRIRLTLGLTRNAQATDAMGHQVPAHTGYVEFMFGRVFTDPNDCSTTPNQISNLSYEYDHEHTSASIHFSTAGATSNNLKCLIDYGDAEDGKGHNRVHNIRLTQAEKEMVKYLCQLTHITEGKTRDITIMIRPGAKEKESHKNGTHNAIDDMLDKLPFKGSVSTEMKHSMTVVPLDQYRDVHHKPRVQYGEMPTPKRVYDEHHPCLPMRPVAAWPDADIASITLANSVHVQHVEAEVILDALMLKLQKVKLLTLGDMILIAVTWDKQVLAGLSADERITYPLGTQIFFTVHNARTKTAVSDDVKPRKAFGNVINNVYNVSCDVLVAIQNKKAEDFLGMTSPLRSGKDAVSYWAGLEAKVNNNSCKAMIYAVATTYERGSWVTAHNPALLNDGAALALRDLFDSVTCTEQVLKHALHELMTARSWNRGQLAHIDQVMHAPGGMALLTGSSGSGKTEIMVHIMAYVLRLGFTVICTGMKHATLDLIAKKFENKFPQLEAPLRAYNPTSESLSIEEPVFTASDESDLLALDMIRAELAEHKKKRTRLQSENSIQHRVLQNMDRTDMPEMIRMIASGSECGIPVYADKTLHNFRQIFKDGLAAREEHPFSDKEFWTDERMNLFKHAYEALRAEVIQNSKVLVTTMLNAYNKEVRQNFSQNKMCIRFDDEAQACAEQPSLIPSSICGYSKNIKLWCMYGDLKQSGVINLTGKNFDNTVDVFYKQSDMSLFLRLNLMGHPLVDLRYQWRQNEHLFEMLNQLHYHMSIITTGNMKKPMSEHTTLMGKVLGLTDAEIAKQTEKQKRMLYVNVATPTMKSRDSHSRANPGYAAWVILVLFPLLLAEFGEKLQEDVMLIVPYAKQKELYLRWYFELRKQGWTDKQLPRISTIDVSHGDESKFVILDLVNDEYEGFLQDPARTCVAWGRAKDGMFTIGGNMSQVDDSHKVKKFRDATDGDKLKDFVLYRPIRHWKRYYEDNLCAFKTAPPEFVVPDDLAFYDEVESQEDEATAPVEDEAKSEEEAVAPTEDEAKSGEEADAPAGDWGVSEWNTAATDAWTDAPAAEMAWDEAPPPPAYDSQAEESDNGVDGGPDSGSWEPQNGIDIGEDAYKVKEE
ncbi:hypothetical protein AUEXF2481DRAFT_92785 [Aureobasidium subglaciale EXF-2481]|uniref:DNA2/NAM7 helicase-like C-terminal domain-containing protein n=1 Tax=Aureobasidium subglaciale (strain EXF-2481) TaxID=1043005 RepID=A0A074XYS1_AURSE|nr:uncharacterized protein AUEXF2481DRAFT_92785 [Aureobasidium subglaciale EXF-2481]KAI5201536.1 hypothetical protein E4T38_06066 [Aureobasidium subglaciale]KAI5220095.1 hypothetical protein E4T40_06087 [Aureobasidium subglaciale]KAI5223990.1 hypothetical protein E4T41_05927 [Aureobasidium subglaciale]KAI5260639.1 hypothetical protein E4T46_05821 [Aureobasidium subglaciale]KEQ90683.1 hypothetical protein AUEXF2481DRAFT_92785 [Aureobasidium subglaciale EXF-2481]